MTREEAIKELKELEYYNRPFDNSETEDKKAKALFMAIKALEQMPRWIPVSEPPKKEGRYICDYGDCIDFGSYHDGHWYIQGAVAYMTLPQPYKGEMEDKN